MSNRVYLREFFIEIQIEGDQTAETVDTAAEKAAGLATSTWGQGVPYMVLVDVTRMGRSTNESRRSSVGWVRRAPIKRMAVVANSIFLRNLSRLILRAAGKFSKMQVFSDRQTGVEWLMEVAEMKPRIDRIAIF